MLMGSKNEPSHCVLPLGGLMEWDFMGIDHDISKKHWRLWDKKHIYKWWFDVVQYFLKFG
jgi:hypothetical protein